MTAPAPTSLVDDRYQLHGLIGSGGMCNVYRAEDLRDGSQVAIKVMPPERAANAEMAARFGREAAAGKRIKHPNVVRIHDSGKLKDGSLYLVMELVEGVSLGHELEKGPLPIPRALEIAKQMLLGLAAAHELAISHRDVKPDNVLLGKDGAKLADFGIASNERAAFKLTAAGLAFGTPDYISPEMAMGLQTDPRADLYSVGVVLFQMVTGRLPFAATDQTALLRAHIERPPPSPRSFNKEISPALEALILKSLKKLPEERFPNATAMAIAIHELKPKKARWLWVAAVVVVLAALAAIWWLQTAPTPSPPPKMHLKKSK